MKKNYIIYRIKDGVHGENLCVTLEKLTHAPTAQENPPAHSENMQIQIEILLSCNVTLITTSLPFFSSSQ